MIEKNELLLLWKWNLIIRGTGVIWRRLCLEDDLIGWDLMVLDLRATISFKCYQFY